jgi:hypothetical protein
VFVTVKVESNWRSSSAISVGRNRVRLRSPASRLPPRRQFFAITRNITVCSPGVNRNHKLSGCGHKRSAPSVAARNDPAGQFATNDASLALFDADGPHPELGRAMRSPGLIPILRADGDIRLAR